MRSVCFILAGSFGLPALQSNKALSSRRAHLAVNLLGLYLDHLSDRNPSYSRPETQVSQLAENYSARRLYFSGDALKAARVCWLTNQIGLSYSLFEIVHRFLGWSVLYVVVE